MDCKKVKVKEADLYSAFIEVPYTQGAHCALSRDANRAFLFIYFSYFFGFMLLFLLFCCLIIASSMGLCLSRNREINM